MKIGKWLAGFAMACGLVACGGSGDAGTSVFGSGGTPSTGTTVVPAVELSVSNRSITATEPATITAKVTSSDGKPLSGLAVKFSLAQSNVTLSADTVTSDSAGFAKTVLSAKPSMGNVTDTLTAKVTLGANTASASVDLTANSANTIEVLASSNSAVTSGDQVSLTAIVKGSGNAGLSNVPVTFVADSGIILSPVSATDSTGAATAKFSVGSDKSNRSARITVTSGSATGVLVLPIEGTKLSVSGDTTLAMGSVNTFNVKAVDFKGNGISGAQISVASSLGNSLGSTTVTTNSQGDASVAYTAAKSGSDTVSFSGLGASTSTVVSISSEDFSVVSPSSGTTVPLGTAQTIQVRYRQNGLPVANKVVNFASTAGVLSATSATTDSNGLASVSVSSIWAAPATVSAKLSGGAAQASVPIVFVAKIPARVVLQVSPTTIGPNASGSLTNQAQIVAKVTDANGNPVYKQTVNFSRDADASGGNFLQATGDTDENGVATVQYVAGPQSTATNGVILRATVAGYASVTGTAGLTVSQSALFIALGTGNSIDNLDPQTYKKQWTVYVTDAAGVAVPNVNITAKILPIEYQKGTLYYNGTVWTSRIWNGSTGLALPTQSGTGSIPSGYYISCKNEDTLLGDGDSRSLNGVLDSGEDLNGNGVLEPGNVISLENGITKTDSSGRATLTLLYAETYVPWVYVRLQVQAVVSGTESITEARFVVSGVADDFKDATIPPAGIVSPFGTLFRYDVTKGAFVCNVPN